MHEVIIPIHNKYALTLKEASLYSGIGINKLRDITNNPANGLCLFSGNKRLIRRKQLEEYLDCQIEV